MIHQTAIVSKNAELANDVEIGPYAIIGDGVKLARGAKIGAYSVVEYAEIGENCTIFSHCSIGTAPQDLSKAANDYSGDLRKQTDNEGNLVFKKVGTPRIELRGNNLISWSFTCELNRGGEE